MQHSNKPSEELQLARELIERMELAQSIGELEGFWKRFLQHLDRVWNKAEAHFGRSPKWSGWHGKYAKLRKQDQLLRYLMQARNSDEHSINEITQKVPGFIAINGVGPNNELRIKNLVIENDKILELITPSPFFIKRVASKVNLLPVENRGVVYQPPTEHLGEKINPDDLIKIASSGISFYTGFLHAAEDFFVISPTSS